MATGYVYSVNPNPVFLARNPLGEFAIDACPKGEDYAVLVIEDRKQQDYTGNDTWKTTITPGEEIAAEFGTMYRDHGIFVTPGRKPKAEDVAKARESLRTFYFERVREADSAWERKHDRGQIEEVARQGARYLGLTPEWSYGDMTGETKSCPFCAETIKSAAVKCRFCGEHLYATDGSTKKGAPAVARA